MGAILAPHGWRRSVSRRYNPPTMRKQGQRSQNESRIGRRDLFKLGAGAAAAMALMRSPAVSAQEGPAWETRPPTGTPGPVSIDMHTHWAREAYTNAQIEMERPRPANPFPLDSD